jgi:hypothetical protein
MSVYDFAALESIEFAACTDLYRAAPADIEAAYDIEVREFAEATCLSCRKVDPAMIFRRVVGLGVGKAASEANTDAVVAHMRTRGDPFTITCADEARPAELSRWLEARGFERGYAWMKFSRACADPPEAGTDLDVRTVGREHAGAFGHVVTDAFGLPAAIAPWIGGLPGRPGWVCAMAFDGDTPAAAGAAFVSGEHAWLGFGGTLATHRRHGAQGALLAHRLREAAGQGAQVAVTETGERLPDLPGNSYRNILRAGFEERYLRQNFVSPENH